MKVGFIGLGKLGLPVALSIEHHGHEVVGYDINPAVKSYIENRAIPYREAGTPEYLQDTKIRVLDTVDEVVSSSDIIFVPVQTPHNPEYEGITRLPKTRVDFDYTFLKNAISSVCESAKTQQKHITLITISTCLPGTFEREIKPLLNEFTHYCYNPYFIAMGTTRSDFEKPEFVLLGCDDELWVKDTVKKLYTTIHNKPVFETTIINAELIKVCYNTFISTKIAYINTIMEVCDKMGANIDSISSALSLATDRIISMKYLRGGNGDGGGCHPRDNIALSWLSQQLNLSHDYFDHIMISRERQQDWFASIIESELDDRPVVIMGEAFKKETNLILGSPSILLKNILQERDIESSFYDPHTRPETPMTDKPSIFFIGCNHDEFKTIKFPKGSTVIDIWGMIDDQDGVKVKRIGRWGKK